MAKKLFDHINHIKYNQDKSYYSRLSHEDRKSYSTFMILKFLSMDSEITQYVNYLNKFQGTLSDENMYRLIIEILPIKNYKTTYLKNKKIDYDNDVIKVISELYNISEKKSLEYLQFLDDDKINRLFHTLGKERTHGRK